MTPTPEQNAKRFIELSENVSVLSTTETNAVILARAYLALETELQQKQKIIENHCKDWAEDDTAIKEICKRFGVPDVHPVGDDFKSCVECVEELAEKLQQLRLAADGMAESLKEARRFLFETPFGGIHRDAILVQINQISKSEAAYRALAGESLNQAE